MCEISAGQRRTFRDQDPPRIRNKSTENLLKDEADFSHSTPNSPTVFQRASSLEKCFSEPDFLEKKQRASPVKKSDSAARSSPVRASRENSRLQAPDASENGIAGKDFRRELSVKVPSSCRRANEVISNGVKCDVSDICDGLTNAGRKMAPVLGVPPPPPPAPHMGPDGLILPRKPYNPCLTSTNHKDLHRELLFNQKIGRNVLNQKSELQRALEKQREAASRREAEKAREENYQDDPRTALQKAIEQRAKHIQSAQEQAQQAANPPNNLLMTARAKLRPRTESQ